MATPMKGAMPSEDTEANVRTRERDATLGANRTWIVALDCGKTSAPLVRWLIRSLTQEGDVVRLVHVIPGTFPAEDSVSMMMGDFYPVGVPDAKQEAAQRNEAIQWIQDHITYFLEEAKLSYVIDIVPYDMQTGSIGEIMVEKSELIDEVAAIVLASTSKGRIREFFIGSVCNYVLHHAKKPVFVYKPTAEDERLEEERVKTMARSEGEKKDT